MHIQPLHSSLAHPQMTNHLHIPTRPRPGRATVTLYCYPYNKATGKTMTRYVGSLRLDMDPDALPLETVLQPGERCCGLTVSARAPFALQRHHMETIRQWLNRHGTYRQHRHAQQARERQEREALKAVCREEVRQELAQAQADAQRQARAQTVGYALVEAEAALLQACDELLAEAQTAAAGGHALSHRRSLNTAIRPGMSPLDVLQARANRIRVDALARLEQVCQAAGLMVKPARRGVRKAAAR